MSPLTARYSPKTLITCALSAALLLGALILCPANADAATTKDAKLTATVVKTINKVRVAHHLPKLAVQPRLKATAKAHTAKMAKANKRTTRVAGEPKLTTRVKRAGYAAKAVKERVGVARSKGKVVAVAKKLAAKSRSWKVMGVSVRTDKKHKKIWVTVDYAVPAAKVAAHHAAAAAPASASAAHTSSKPASVEQSIANGVLTMLNSERAAHGRARLSMNAKLVNSAHAHNLAMAAANSMSHQLPGEANLGDRVLKAGYDFHYAGENIGYNTDMTLAGAKLLEQLMYDEGPPPAGVVNHYANIVSTQYKNVGIDIYLDNAHHRLWITEDFGTSF